MLYNNLLHFILVITLSSGFLVKPTLTSNAIPNSIDTPFKTYICFLFFARKLEDSVLTILEGSWFLESNYLVACNKVSIKLPRKLLKIKDCPIYKAVMNSINFRSQCFVGLANLVFSSQNFPKIQLERTFPGVGSHFNVIVFSKKNNVF